MDKIEKIRQEIERLKLNRFIEVLPILLFSIVKIFCGIVIGVVVGWSACLIVYSL